MTDETDSDGQPDRDDISELSDQAAVALDSGADEETVYQTKESYHENSRCIHARKVNTLRETTRSKAQHRWRRPCSRCVLANDDTAPSEGYRYATGEDIETVVTDGGAGVSGSDGSYELEDGKRRIVLFTTADPIRAVRGCPRTVFPVAMSVRQRRPTDADSTHAEYRRPGHPVSVSVSHEQPYVGTDTIYFDNPADRAPPDRSAWGQREFVTSFKTLSDVIERQTVGDAEPIRVISLCLVEIPPHYLTTDDGRPAADPALYDDRADIKLAYFEKDDTLRTAQVREHLDDAMRESERTPLQLVRVDEVTAKPARSGRETTQRASRARYYTESEAAAHNRLDATPGVWKTRSATGWDESVRPLEPALTHIDRLFPSLSDSELVTQVSLRGQTESEDRFYAGNVIGRSNADTDTDTNHTGENQ